MTPNQEVELKFELPPGDRVVQALRAELEARFGPGEPVRLTSTYFDTPDLALREASVSLRVRDAKGRRLQTIKARNGGNGHLFARSEWEREVDGDAPDLAAAKDTPLAALVEQREVKEALRPAFQSVIERTIWNVAADEGEVEVALDEGEIKADGRSAPVRELELELKSGQPSTLISLAKTVDEIAPLRLAGRSKADRGYQLIEKTDRAAVPAEDPALTLDMPAARAFQVVARGCMRHFMLNEPLLIRNRSPDALHQCRVALRRLRSAISLFRPIVAGPELEGLKARLRELLGPLGAARDMDLFLQGLEGRDSLDAQALAAQVRHERDAAYDHVIAALEGAQARRLMFDLAIWIEAGGWTRAETELGSEPVERYAAKALDRLHRRLKKSGRHLDRLGEEERHAVRIEAKKLRYAAEFFAGLYPDKRANKRMRGYLSALKGLQTELGELNDIATAADLASKLTDSFAARSGGARTRKQLIFAAGREIGRREAEAPRRLQLAVGAFERLSAAKRFWARG